MESPGFGGAERDLIRVIDLVSPVWARHVVAHGRPLARELEVALRDRGVSTVPITAGSRISGVLPAWRSASALLARFPRAVWVVWCHHFDACRWLQQRLACSGRPFVIAERSMGWTEEVFTRSRLTRPLKRRAARASRGVVVPGAGQAGFYPELFGLRPEAIRFVPNSRPVQRIAARVERARSVRAATRRERGIPEDAFVVLSVARLHRDKGQELLVEAAALARRTLPALHLCLVGSGPAEERLRALAQRHLPGGHTMAGERSDVDEYLAAADVFGLASTFEGLSGAILEAMAAGVAVIASDIPANRELVQHEKTGLLCALADAGQWSAAMIRVARDPVGASAWAHAARALVMRGYDEPVERDGWLELLEELAA